MKRVILILPLIGILLVSGCTTKILSKSELKEHPDLTFVDGIYYDRDCDEYNYKFKCRFGCTFLEIICTNSVETIMTCSDGYIESYGGLEEFCLITRLNSSISEEDV
ncbi:MAG: hypothetical protein JSW41_05450 [Candidatus Aenigmatarchaeota archaeon]|nr:MAG: hypothetical protein JSW41_05450 [Candidatus Aenigmarchaeota archaeon]